MIPSYKQLPNACGLSTFLMLINPEENSSFKQFLSNFYAKIHFLVPKLSISLRNELGWAVALNYLLLKSLGRNDFNDHLNRSLDIFEFYSITTQNILQSGNKKELKQLPELFSELFFSFFENFLINPYVFSKSLFMMRTDLDLKILFSLFGGVFFPQEQESADGTGALYFTKNDFKIKIVDHKLSILKTHLLNSKNDNIPCIALNLSAHWVAVNSVDDKKVYFNDPSSGRTNKIKINKHIPERYRFYLFSYDPKKAIVLREEIKEFLNSEVEKELNQVKKFTRTLLENVDDLKRLAVEQIEEEITEKNIVVVKQGEKLEIPSSKEKDLLPEPLSGENIMDRIRKKIRESFSDYSKI